MKLFCFKYLNFAVLLLLLLFFTEAYFKIISFSIRETPRLLQITKGFILFGLTCYLLIKKRKGLLLLGVLFISFIIGQLALNSGFSKEILIVFVKQIYLIILFIFFNSYVLSIKQKERLFLVFENILVFNSLLIFIGLILDVEIFNSYYGSRFGFNGLFVTSATSSYVYCITLIYLLAKYKKAVFKNFQNIIIIVSMFFIGTKVSYLFLFSFFVIYLLKYSQINKKLIAGIFVLFAIVISYLTFFKFGLFNNIREEHGLISSLMSYRNQLFLEKTLPFIKDNWSVGNYFFGGVSNLATKSQIEFIDIFFFFGLIGGFLYYYLFFKAFITFKTNIYIVVLLSILFFIVLLAGNFFSYPSIAIYLVILKEYLNCNEQNQHT